MGRYRCVYVCIYIYIVWGFVIGLQKNEGSSSFGRREHYANILQYAKATASLGKFNFQAHTGHDNSILPQYYNSFHFLFHYPNITPI